MSTPIPASQRLWNLRDFRIGLTFLLGLWAFLTLTEWGVAVAHFNHLVTWLQLMVLIPGAAALGCALASAVHLVRSWRQRRAAAPDAAQDAAQDAATSSGA